MEKFLNSLGFQLGLLCLTLLKLVFSEKGKTHLKTSFHREKQTCSCSGSPAAIIISNMSH